MTEHSRLVFTETTLDACTQAAERFAERGDDWHNHVLKPTCLHNPRPGKYVLVIENNSSGEVLGYVGERNPVEAEQHIVRLRHGSDIIGEEPGPATQGDEPEIVARIRELIDKDVDWHHHMMLPNCVLNPTPGRWRITLESRDEGEILEYIADEEPRATLRTIETLFFDCETKRGNAR